MDPSQWASIRLRTNPAFQWLIPDSTDTTATATHCAYDRIVVAGTLLQHAIVPDSATPFDFQAAYGLSSQLVGVLPYVLQLCWDPRTSGSFCINLSHWDQHVVWGPVTKYHVQSRPCTCPHYAFPHRPRPLATITRWR